MKCPKGGEHDWVNRQWLRDNIFPSGVPVRPQGPGPWYVCRKCGETGYAIRDRKPADTIR